MIIQQLEDVDVKDHKCVRNVGDLWNVLVALCNCFVKLMDLKNISLILVAVVVCIAGYVINKPEQCKLIKEKHYYYNII